MTVSGSPFLKRRRSQPNPVMSHVVFGVLYARQKHAELAAGFTWVEITNFGGHRTVAADEDIRSRPGLRDIQREALVRLVIDQRFFGGAQRWRKILYGRKAASSTV